MKPLPYTRPRIGQSLRPSGWFSPAVIGSLLLLEVVGRQTTSDLHDMLGVAALLILGLAVAARHRTAPLAWVDRLARLGARLLRWGERFKVDLGLDLRGSPPIPRRMPPGTYLITICLVVWTAGMLAVWHFFPQGWRDGAVQVFYILYLVGVILFWGMVFLGILGGVYFPIMLLTRLFPQMLGTGGAAKPSRGQLVAILSYLMLLFLASRFLPLWVAPLLCALTLAALGVLRVVLPGDGVQFIWRPRGSRRVYSVPAGQLFVATAALFLLILLALVVTACGGLILGSESDLSVPASLLAGGIGKAIVPPPPPPAEAFMPLTLMLGTSLAWLTPGMILCGSVWVWLAWRRSPSRHCPPVVHVSGQTVPAVQSRLTRVFRRWGWEVRFEPQPPLITDVRIILVEPAQSCATEFDPVWPLRVSVEDLEEGSVRDRLERRFEIQCRRILLKGLERLLKVSRERQFSGGSGFWLAPHLWLMSGMTRDDIEDGEGNEEPNLLMRSVGPPYHLVFPRPVRNYLYRLLRALEVDLFFVEDGINHRKLNRIMRVLFEVYDKFAGKRRAEEVQFQGLPKVKVLIHDFQMDQPFESSTYPEPRFEDLGRARILHVFRDRGDHEERVEPPFDWTQSPAPLGMN